MSDSSISFQRHLNRRSFLAASAVAGVGASGLLSACGGSDSPSGNPSGGGDGKFGSGSLVWGSWANPGEAERFKQYSKDYQTKSGVKVEFQTVVGDYNTKLVTQLAGGSAPDAFYIGDGLMAKVIESGSVVNLNDYLASPNAAVKATDVYPGLIQWCKKDDGIYGIPVDCNPKVFWFNKAVLAEAGVAQNPAELQDAGSWNQAALDELLGKVKATGKRGMVFEATWFDLCGWITALGGKALDDEGNAVFDQDDKAIAILKWLWDHIAADTIAYGGSLPKGQGVDALFYGSQLATIQYGRWILPNLKKTKIEYDIAPLPSESGKDISVTSIYTAAMGVNSKAKNPEAALAFLGNFVNADGQRARLAGGGNAVPCMAGLDEVTTEGGLPEHGKWFTEIAAKGYTVPQVLVENAAVATNFNANLDKLIKEKPDYKTFATKAAALMNGKA